MRVDINVQGTLATGGGYLTVTATRRNSLGTAYSGVTAVLTRIAQLSAVTSGSFSENLNGVMQAATGDYITITTVFSPGSLGSITSIPIQLTKVG